MRLLAALLVIAVIVVAILGPQAFFVVDETQLAIVTRFGDPRKVIDEPGLNFKTPFVDSVTYFDKRLLIFDAPPDSLLTKDKKRLVIDVYARGRIEDPLVFFRTVRTLPQSASRAVDIISSELRREIANDDQSEIIKTSRGSIMVKVRDAITPNLSAFGIEVVDVRIKRADFPAEIADSIYARMQAERKRKADRERAEGAEVDAEVRADVDRLATIIRAEAERDASIIRGCGEAEAIKIFAEALQQDPEFFTFQRSLEAYRSFLTQNTTLVMAVSEFGQLFEGIRQGVIEGTAAPDTLDSSASEPVDFGSRCAEVAATRLLSRSLGVDLSELVIVSVEGVLWPASGPRCPQDGDDAAELTVPGYTIHLSSQGETYKVNTNKQGSQVVSCAS